MKTEDHIGSVIEPTPDAASAAVNAAESAGAASGFGWLGWATRGAMAALEQGSVSGSNFVLSVAMARWLSPAAYGEFAVGFSMLLLAAAIFQAVFLAPLMVHLPTLDAAQRAGYLRTLLRMHAWGSAVAAGAAQLPALREQIADPDPSMTAAEAWRTSRRSGRWEVWNSIALWAPVHLTFPVTAGILGPSMTGALRALQNFAMPLNQTVAALSRLVFPYLCQHSAGGGEPLQQGRRIAWAGFGMGLAYTAVLWLAAGPVVQWPYGGAYDEHAWLMPLAILPMAFWGGAQALGLALRAAGRFPSVLVGSVAVGVAFAAAVVPATKAYGLAGALGAAAGSQALGLALLVVFARGESAPAAPEAAIPAEGGPA